MLEVRGVDAYERFALSGGRSRPREEDGAEFKQLMQTGETPSQPQAPVNRTESADDGLFVVSGPGIAMYDGFGKIAPSHPSVGRNYNATI